jgi:hypothetical protein
MKFRSLLPVLVIWAACFAGDEATAQDEFIVEPGYSCIAGDTLDDAIVWTKLYFTAPPPYRFYCDSVQVSLNVSVGGYVKAALYTANESLALSDVVPALSSGQHLYTFRFPSPDSGLNAETGYLYVAIRGDQLITVVPGNGRDVSFKSSFPYTNDWPMGLPAPTHVHLARGFQINAFAHYECQ